MSKLLIYDASSLADIYDIVSEIACLQENKGQPLWFRGQDINYYDIIPSAFQPKNDHENKWNGYGYSSIQQMEELKYMNFQSKVFHRINSNPNGKTEWLELLQHHLGHTRLMDWSESMRTSLSFSLEAFLDPRDTVELAEKRKSITPTLWVLNPGRLNQKVYEYFMEDQNIFLIKKALKEFYPDPGDDLILEKFSKDMQAELKKYREIYFPYGNQNKMIEIQGIICLCILGNMRKDNMARMQALIRNGEFNPFFYLLLRYYEDSLPVELKDQKRILPPLATLQPYHSERIRSQRGVFVVVPNYILSDAMKQMKQYGKDIRAMNHQDICQDCMYKIRLLRPAHIAEELICAGERMSELYPDIDRYVHVLETNKYYY